MTLSNFSICTRCGKKRVLIRTYKELVGLSMVTYTETACPDKECQKEVESKLLQEEQRREQFTKSSEAHKNQGNKKKVN